MNRMFFDRKGRGLRKILPVLTMALAVAAFPKGASAETLVPILINETAITIIDADSIRANGQMKRAWVYVGLPRDRGTDAYIADFIEFDCIQGRYRSLNRKFFDIRGRMTFEDRDPTTWNVGLPISPATSAMNAVCEDNYSRSVALPGYSVLQLVEQYRRLAGSRE